MTCFSIHSFLRQVSVVDILFSEYDTEEELESDSDNFLRQVSVVDILFSEYDTEEELESDSDNRNQGSTTNNFFTATDQEFMLQFGDHITNELFQVFN